MYRTITIRGKFTDEEKAFWVDQCQHSTSLINCAIYHTRQSHYAKLESMDNALTLAGVVTNCVVDGNAAANMLREVATQLGLYLAEVGRASLTVPQRYDLFKRLNKLYRQRCLACIETA